MSEPAVHAPNDSGASKGITRPFDSLPLLPGARGFLGHMGDIQNDRLAFSHRLALETSDVVRLSFPAALGAAVLTPRALEELLVTRVADFEKSAMMVFTLGPLAGDGLFTSKGELWKRQRRLMAPLFTPASLDRYAEAMVACTERVAAGWRDGQRIDLSHETTRIAMSIAGATLFDTDTLDETDEIGQALTTALQWASDEAGSWFAVAHIKSRALIERLRERTSGRANDVLAKAAERLRRPLFYPGERGAALVRAIDVLDRRVQRMIDARRAAGLVREDLLSRLLSAHHGDAARMSDRQVRDEVLTLFVAGHETTATSLAWSLVYASQDRALYRALSAEARGVGPNPGIGDLPRLGLALRVFKEALRIRPPVYLFGRSTVRDSELCGTFIPKDTQIVVSPYATHHLPAIWPDPERFDPDRFLPENDEKRPRGAYQAFSAGPRVCIGNHFALMEAQLVLAVLLSKFDFELAPGTEVEPEHGATLRAKNAWVTVKKRAR